MSPFRIDIPSADLSGLRRRLLATRWPDELPGAGWDLGVSREYLRALVGYWADGYDWRRQEQRLNALPQATTVIDGQLLHFLHVRSPHPEAQALLLLHGWPGTVADFLPLIGELSDTFHLVVPSLPGFGFSGPTTTAGWDPPRMARAFAALMHRLGYHRYGVQGGDFGSVIAADLGRADPRQVTGVHLNALPTASMPVDQHQAETLTAAERDQVEANKAWWRAHNGYATQMATRPQTLAYALTDSPAGQLAWYLEWFVGHDPDATTQSPVEADAILTDTTILWLTNTAGSAARLYHEAAAGTFGRPQRISGVPTAVANFREDRAVRGLAVQSHRLVRWTEIDAGGHFAALQAPRELAADVREFFASLRC
ncbi:MAG: epoxide hydrolase [Catenulispora sp.]|nr:epoxide hydrolase [Catenulispora sp.]